MLDRLMWHNFTLILPKQVYGISVTTAIVENWQVAIKILN